MILEAGREDMQDVSVRRHRNMNRLLLRREAERAEHRWTVVR